MTRQTFTTTDVLRLEVEVPATGLTNLVTNPDGKLGAWGWLTPVSGSYMESIATGLRFTAPNPAAASYFTTEPIPIASGQYAAAAWDLVAITGYVRVRFEWLSSSYAVLSSSTQSGYLNTLGSPAYAPQLAPASTAFVRLRFDHYATTGGANPTGNAQVTINNVKVAKAATSGALGSGRSNLVRNPSFETNINLWSAHLAGQPGFTTIVRTTAQAYVGTASLALTASGNVGARASHAIAVTPGRDYHIQFRTRAATVARPTFVQVDWLAADATTISSASRAGILNSTSSWPRITRLVTAPAEAVVARITVGTETSAPGEVHYIDAVMVTEGVDVPTYFDGATAAAGTLSYSWSGTAHASTSNLTDTTLGSLVPTNWRNVLGPTHDIKVDRESLNLGILTATILDATLDPSQSDQMRPGRMVRLLTSTDALTWESLFTGKATKLEVTYDEKAARPKPPRISLAAVDATQPLTAARRPDGVATIPELPFVLEGAGVPWRVNGSGNQIPAANIVATNDNATALDQIAITRDTALGTAFVDRTGVLVVNDYVPSQTFTNGTFDVNATGWTAMFAATLARVTTPVADGAGALRITSSTGGASGASSATGTAGVPVQGGATYRLTAKFRAATTGRNIDPLVRWYNAAGALISGQGKSGIVDTSTGWTTWTETFVAPPNATFLAVDMTINGSVTSEIHYMDSATVALVTTERLLDESVYSELDLAFSSEGCINSVSVKYLRYNATDATTEEVVYGPYEDATSISSWGRRSAEFVVQGIGEANVPAYAAKILTRNANPELKAGSVLVPIAAPADLPRALWDLGDNARVKNAAKALDKTLRVDQLTHTITSGKWLLELGFTGTSTVASPQATPPVSTTPNFYPGNALRGLATAVDSVGSATWWTLSKWAAPVQADCIGTLGVGIVYLGTGVWRIDNPGWYAIDLRATFAAAAGRLRASRLIVAGGSVASSRSANIATIDWTTTQFHWEGRITAGTQIRFEVYQDSGAALDVLTSDAGTGYSIRRIDA